MRKPSNLADIFPELPTTTPNPEPLPTIKPHGYRQLGQPKAKPARSFYEITTRGNEAVVVRRYDLLPVLTQHGLSFEVARVAAQAAQKSLLAGGGTYEIDGLTIRRFEE